MVGVGDGHAGTECLLKRVPYLGKRDLAPHETEAGTIRVSFLESFIEKASERHMSLMSRDFIIVAGGDRQILFRSVVGG